MVDVQERLLRPDDVATVVLRTAAAVGSSEHRAVHSDRIVGCARTVSLDGLSEQGLDALLDADGERPTDEVW